MAADGRRGIYEVALTQPRADIPAPNPSFVFDHHMVAGCRYFGPERGGGRVGLLAVTCFGMEA